MSETSNKESRLAFKVSPLVGGVIILVATVVLLVWLNPLNLRGPTHNNRRAFCVANLHQLGLVLRIYADERQGQFPAAAQWCDAVSEYGPDESFKNTFLCPKAKTGPCNYAMNPDAEPNSAPDVVLLFESRPGWNQYGGPELLTVENHDGKGCNVLFVDGHVEFVQAKDVDDLKWTDAEKPSQESDEEPVPVTDEESNR